MLLGKKSVLAAKIETTPGDAISLSASDAAFNVYDAQIVPDIQMDTQEAQGGFGKLASVPAGLKGRMQFKTFLQWDGTATEPAWADTFFPACGWVKSGQVYTPRSEVPGTNVKTLTMGRYVDGTLYTLTGCMGTFKVNLPTGRVGFIEWDFLGVWAGRTDASILSPTHPTAANLRFAGGVSQWNNVDLCTSNVVIDAGNELYLLECANGDDALRSGHTYCVVTDRTPIVTADPLAVTVAAQDRWGAWLSRSEFALEMYCPGPTTSQLRFDAPKAQIINNTEALREKLVADQIQFQCNKNGSTADQELSITFTAAV